ncbi:MAG: ABC transporter substrate-binding protein [Mogibacterium sp.]|nr:ABC transporter substrate-binding protein [Mogibacterium sp.]
MKKKVFALMLALAMIVSLCACGGGGSQAEKQADVSSMSWDEIVEQAKGSKVAFYGWGGDENRNKWLNGTVADYLKKNYDIEFEYVGMDINDILAKLTSEKEAGEENGTIDMIWINGENFYTAKENGLLYGPFTDKLPNMEAYIDADDPETLNDFCKPIDGYEAPYAKAQMVMYNDSAVSPETPASAEELMEYAKKYPGKVTYPALPDFTGSAFVRNIIYETCGWEQFQTMEADKETVKKAIQPAIDYLKELNPYLWNEGKTFPADSTALDKMFQDGEVVLDMSYSPFTVATSIADGTLPETCQTFVFDKGTIGNTNYMAIAYDAPNKAGAMVAINAIISPELQLTQYSELRDLPVVDQSKLSDEEKAAFDKVDLGKGVLTQSDLLSHRLPEMPADLVPIIEEIWAEEVVGK